MKRTLLALAAAVTVSAAPAQSATVSLPEAAAQTGQLDTFLSLLRAANLEEDLGIEGPFTIFAPTDDAFAAMSADELERLMGHEGFAERNALIHAHIARGALTSADIINWDFAARTLDGDVVVVDGRSGSIIVNDGAKVVAGDIEAANGVIHVIDRVLTAG